MGRSADCDVASMHPRVNLDNKTFPIEIVHLMHLLQIFSSLRPSLRVLQTVEIFSNSKYCSLVIC